MSLLTSHSSANRVVDSALVVTYSCSLLSGSWSYTSANVTGYYQYMWELHRRARKSYRYVGMTYDAAQTCKAAMLALYQRAVRTSKWRDDVMGGQWDRTSAGNVPMADVAVAHNDDGSYDVVVNVNEDDMCMSMQSAIDISTYFSNESLRSYDGETESGSSS